MNFDEASALAARVIREDGEWQYQGLDDEPDGTWTVLVYSRRRAEYRTLSSSQDWRRLQEAQDAAQALPQ